MLIVKFLHQKMINYLTLKLPQINKIVPYGAIKTNYL